MFLEDAQLEVQNHWGTGDILINGPVSWVYDFATKVTTLTYLFAKVGMEGMNEATLRHSQSDATQLFNFISFNIHATYLANG